MSNDIRELAQQRIDAEIRELHERIRSLRSSRNALSPVHSMPPEVVTQIFKWVQIFYRGVLDDFNSQDIGFFPRWIRVTHVFRYWRNIALNSQCLYTTLVSTPIRYSREFVKFSGSSPLTIIDTNPRTYNPGWRNSEWQQLSSTSLSRVQRLWLGRQGLEFLLPHIERLRPPLKELSLRGGNTSSPALFPPSLQHLWLHLCSFDSYDWLFRLSNLVYLSMFSDSEDKIIAVDTLLNILDEMPRLINLILMATLKPALTPVHRVSPSRPKLQYLRLRNKPDAIVECLPWLTFAPQFNCCIEFLSFMAPNFMDAVPPVLDILNQRIRASSMVLRTAGVDLLGCPRDAMITFSQGAGEEPCLHFNIGPMVYRTSANMWMKNAAVLPLDNIETLTMNVPCDVEGWSDSPWRDIRTLRQLVLKKGETSLGFLEYIIKSNEAQRGDHTGGFTPFHSLEEITLYGINDSHDVDNKSKILTAFTGRRDTPAVKLRKLALQKCIISESLVQELSEVVDVVEL